MLLQMVRQTRDPARCENLPAHLIRTHVHHAISRDRSWRSFKQVFNFKHHNHLLSQFDDLSRDQAKLLVVIQDRIEILNPNRINRSIQHDPVSVPQLVTCRTPHCRCKDAILPVSCHFLKVSVKLADTHTLGVDLVDPDSWASKLLVGLLAHLLVVFVVSLVSKEFLLGDATKGVCQCVGD